MCCKVKVYQVSEVSIKKCYNGLQIAKIYLQEVVHYGTNITGEVDDQEFGTTRLSNS